MNASANDETMTLDEQARHYGVATAILFGVDDDLEVFEVDTITVPAEGGLCAVITRCRDNGEEASLFDDVGCHLGSVACDGSLDWNQ